MDYDRRRGEAGGFHPRHRCGGLRVGFDARCLQTASAGGGIGRYARGLLEHLPGRVGEIVVYLSSRLPEPTLRLKPPMRAVTLGRPARGITLWDPILWPGRLRRDGIDLFHSPFYGVPARRPAGTTIVATVHDLIPLLFPESVTPRQRMVFTRHFRAALCADRIIVPSCRTREDLVERLGADPGRIDVVPLGIDEVFARPAQAGARERLTGGRPYILNVGGFDPLKNIPLLIEAFARNAGRSPEPDLVICGDTGGRTGRRTRSLIEIAERLGIRERLHLPGRLADADLAAAYAEAELFVFPSRYEGFGLPPLEAMAAGCPVVSSTGGSLGEVLGDAAVLVPAGNDQTASEALSDAIRQVLDDASLRQRLVAAGGERVRRFRWEAAAEKTVEVYVTASVSARGGSAPVAGTGAPGAGA